jgi:hypothetical protein
MFSHGTLHPATKFREEPKIGGVVDSLNYNLVIATLLTLIVLFAEGFYLNPSAGKSHAPQIIFTLSSLIGFLLFLKRKLKNNT